MDDYYFVQPIAARQRRTLLKQAGLAKIDATEKHELTLIRRSREVCGCSCTRETGGCQPLTCECYINGIACQVDRLTFPCPCATMLCKNPLGRLEFNQNRVRNHFIETITRLATEQQDEESGKRFILGFILIILRFLLLVFLECSINQEKDLDALSVIEFLLSSIISQIESQGDEISSVLNSLVSSIDDSMMFIQESSSTLPCDIDTNISDSISVSSVNDSIHTQTMCHIDSSNLSIQSKLGLSTRSTTMISNELC